LSGGRFYRIGLRKDDFRLESIDIKQRGVGFGDHSREIARRIILSIADGEDPPAEDVEALVGAVLDSPLVRAAQAVIDAEPRHVRARLIELAAMVAGSGAVDASAEAQVAIRFITNP
jgi:hypothetical protein